MFIGLDTALNNMGAVVLGEDLRVRKRIKLGDELDRFGERIYHQTKRVLDLLDTTIKFVAMEDYPLTSMATSHKTAELVGAIKYALIDRRIPYCMVHPAKTKKFVRKVKVLEKEESIAFADKHAKLLEGEILTDCVRSKKDKGDIAEAWVISMIGMIASHCVESNPNKMDWTPGHVIRYLEFHHRFTVEERWAEILAGGDTGILNKPGLVYHPKREQ